MAKNTQCKAIETRVWLRVPKSEQERLVDVWLAGDEVAYRRLVLELGRLYG